MLTTSLLVTQTFSHSYHIFLVTQTLSHSDPILFSHSPFPWLISHLFLFHSQPQGKHGRYGRRRGLPVDGVSRSGDQIHLPQTLSEERSRDELSDWEQVSWAPEECIVHRQSPPPPVSVMLPRPLIPTRIRHASPSSYFSPQKKSRSPHPCLLP